MLKSKNKIQGTKSYLFLFLLVLYHFVSLAQSSDITNPNIIFIMADDLGYHDLGCYGQTKIETPNIDQLAATGIRFTQCYAGSTVCAPSRSVLMTGQHTGHTTVRGNFSLIDKARVSLKPQDVTVAEMLKKAGYVTGVTGKWGLGESGTRGVPNKQGFDEWFGYLNQANAHSYYPPYLWKDSEKEILSENQNGKKGTYSHDLFTDFSLEFIKRHKDVPFFLYVPYTIPHDNYEIPDMTPYKDKDWPEEEKIYAAMVTRMDRDVGSIMKELKSLHIDNNTLVFFCSDNGAAKRFDDTFESSGILKGLKRDLYEGGVRVPMIVNMPGKVPSGVTSETPWYFADVLPTLAALVHTEAPNNIDGINIWPVLLGKEDGLKDRYFYWEFHEKGFSQAIRWKNWKAVRNAWSTPLELYDLSVDESERYNIAGLHPDLVSKLNDDLKAARVDSQYWPESLLMKE